MEVSLWPIENLKPYEHNPRKLGKHAVAKVAASIKEFGFRQPIVVDEAGVILIGHTRRLAALHLGLALVPVHQALGLSEQQKRALRIADNRTNEENEWDTDLLKYELQGLEGFDLSLSGFDLREVNGYLRGGPHEGEDDVPPVPVAPVTRRGDLWLLGEHRLLCGDATNADDVGRACEMADCLWTDPPYGVEYEGKTSDALTIPNDSAGSNVVEGAIRCSSAVMRPSSPFYVAHPPGGRLFVFATLLNAQHWRIHQQLIWVKDSMVLGHSDYHFQHEPILYGFSLGNGRPGRGNHQGSRWYGDHSQVSVFNIPRPKRSPDHPTCKPVDLVRRCILNSTQSGEIVYDPFLGSGTTLIACETEHRRCYGLEIEPKYCDVIVQRWEKFTGREATHAESGATFAHVREGRRLEAEDALKEEALRS